MREKIQAEQRNYTLDLLRVVAGFIMACWHWIWKWGSDAVITNGYYGFWGWPDGLDGWSWFLGTFTLGFFVFNTGYFMVDHFKKQQSRGVFGQGHDLELVYRYTAKTYISYAPLMLFSTALGWILANWQAGSTLKHWIDTLVWNIWQFVGLSGFGMHQRLSAPTDVINIYAPQCWYIAAFMVFCCVWYCVFVISEKAAIFILCPVMLAMSHVWLDNSAWWSSLDTNGIANLLPCDIVRLWGPLTWGIWGWYLVNAVKKSKLTQKGRNMLSVAFVALLAYALITTWTGYLGGMLNQDFIWMGVAAIVLIQRDPITVGINKALQKFPLAKYMADYASGFYLIHQPIVVFVSPLIVQAAGGNPGVAGAIYLGIVAVTSIPFVAFLRLVLKPLYGRLGKALKLNRPVGKAFEEQVPAAH